MVDTAKQYPDILERLGEIGLLEEHEFLAETTELFLEDARSMIRQMKDACASKDALALGRAAHRVKGAALNLGVASVSGPAKSLEEQAQKGDLHDALPVIAEIEAELVSVGVFMHALAAKVAAAH